MPSVGLIGFERSGKTTLFNALTGADRPTGFSAHQDPPRRRRACARRTTPATLRPLPPAQDHSRHPGRRRFPPGAGFAGALGGGGEPPANALLDRLSLLDALIHVVRAFDNDAVPHPAERVDPTRDIEAMQLELTFADLALIEKRLERIGLETKSTKAAERVAIDREVDLLTRLQAHLGDGGNLLDAPLNDDERASLRHYRFLTERPPPDPDQPQRRRRRRRGNGRRPPPQRPGEHAALAALSARLEEELRQFDPDEAAAYREELGAGAAASAVETALRESFRILGLRSFFTVGEDECRAWTIPAGANAQRAAGRIHSDLERGFIRAEVVRWDDLLDCGSEAEAKKRALLQTHGKDYEVADGDVLHILFNV